MAVLFLYILQAKPYLLKAWRFFLTYFREILIVTLVFVLYNVHSDFVDYKNKVNNKNAVQTAKFEQEKRERERVSKDATDSYNESLKSIKEYYEKHPKIKYVVNSNIVRDHLPDSRKPEADSSGSTQTRNQGTEETSPTRHEGEIQLDLELAAQEVVQCIELIEYTKKQDRISNETKN